MTTDTSEITADITSDITADIAVIGYGPVGVTAANLLGRMGLRVLVIERDQNIYARARAISTDEEVMRIWQRTGLADTMAADMLSGLPLTFVDARGATFLSFTPRGRGNGHPPQQFIYQPAVENTLRAGVTRYPNVEILLGHECIDLTQDASGVDLTVRPTGATDTTDTGAGTRRMRAAYVVAADGGSSPTRTRLGVGFEGSTYEDRWVVIDTRVRTPWPRIDRLRFHCNPARPAVDCPTPLGHHRWEFPVLPGDDETHLTSTDGVRELLADQDITDKHVEVLRAVVYSHHIRFADRWRVGRVFLAGDAAHVMPPWIGQGMASGIRDVDNLCWKLAAAVCTEQTGTEQTGTELGRLLNSYETERMPHVRAVSRAAVFFGRVITERRTALTLVRDAAFRIACALPAVGTYLRGGGWFPSTRYDHGFLTERAGRRRLRRAVGEHLPQPWVQDARGDRTRLDDALGHVEWAVIHLPDRHPERFLDATVSDLDRWRQAGVRVQALLPAGSNPRPGAVVDVENQLRTWMQERGITTLAMRPDSIVYAASGKNHRLPDPPAIATRPRVNSEPPGALATGQPLNPSR